jgi:hypothetical protein
MVQQRTSLAQAQGEARFDFAAKKSTLRINASLLGL